MIRLAWPFSTMNRWTGVVKTKPRCNGSSAKPFESSLQIAEPGTRRIVEYCSNVRLENTSGKVALGALKGDLARSRAIASTSSDAKGAGAVKGSAPALAFSSVAAAAANAPPRASLRKSRLPLLAITLFIHHRARRPARLATAQARGRVASLNRDQYQTLIRFHTQLW